MQWLSKTNTPWGKKLKATETGEAGKDQPTPKNKTAVLHPPKVIPNNNLCWLSSPWDNRQRNTAESFLQKDLHNWTHANH